MNRVNFIIALLLASAVSSPLTGVALAHRNFNGIDYGYTEIRIPAIDKQEWKMIKNLDKPAVSVSTIDIEPFLKILLNSAAKPEERIEAADALAAAVTDSSSTMTDETKGEIVGALVQVLGSSTEAEVRIGAANALGKIGDPITSKALRYWSKNAADDGIKAAAADALKNISGADIMTSEEAFQILLNSGAEPDERVNSANTLAGLAKSGTQDDKNEIVGALVQVLGSSTEAEVRIGAASALGAIGDSSAIEALTYWSAHAGDKGIRDASSAALELIKGSSVTGASSVSEDDAGEIQAPLGTVGIENDAFAGATGFFSANKFDDNPMAGNVQDTCSIESRVPYNDKILSDPRAGTDPIIESMGLFILNNSNEDLTASAIQDKPQEDVVDSSGLNGEELNAPEGLNDAKIANHDLTAELGSGSEVSSFSGQPQVFYVNTLLPDSYKTLQTTLKVDEAGKGWFPDNLRSRPIPDDSAPSDIKGKATIPLEKNRQLLNYLNVDGKGNSRYEKTGISTWCNIFVWDYTSMRGYEVPHWLNGGELSANGVSEWLQNAGDYGWEEVSPEKAQNLSNEGYVVVAAQRNAGGTGHVAIVIPEELAQEGIEAGIGKDGKFYPIIAQAGQKNFVGRRADDPNAFSADGAKISYYVNRLPGGYELEPPTPLYFAGEDNYHELTHENATVEPRLIVLHSDLGNGTTENTYNGLSAIVMDRPTAVYNSNGELIGDKEVDRSSNVHFAVGRDGTVWQLLPMYEDSVNVSYGVFGYRDAISIEMGGTLEQFKGDNISEEQLNATLDLVINIMVQYNIKYDNVLGHYECDTATYANGDTWDRGKSDPGVEFMQVFRVRLAQELNARHLDFGQPADLML
ncbi:MAG: HEAT repeat domain-containing protein [Candidatus Omnitrophota bacterium]